MKYEFSGKLKICDDAFVPFSLQNGYLRLEVSNISSTTIKNIVFTKSEFEGITIDGKAINVHVQFFYKNDWYSSSTPKSLYAAVLSCFVLLDKNNDSKITKIGFNLFNINKILGRLVSGSITLNDLEEFGHDNKLASYQRQDNTFLVLYDFVKKSPCLTGPIISVESKSPFTQPMMEDTFWIMNSLLAFINQQKSIPFNSVMLFDEDILVGYLFVQNSVLENNFIFGSKCIPLNIFSFERLSKTFQAISDGKIYLRHLPFSSYDHDKFTYSRYLITAVGLENVLTLCDVKPDYSEEHHKSIENVKAMIESSIENSNEKYVKKQLKNILKHVGDISFEEKIATALNKHFPFINNFYYLSLLGNNYDTIAKNIAETRNNFAHGNLETTLTSKHAEQCIFMDLFILYFELLFIGFSEKECSEIIPLVVFSH